MILYFGDFVKGFLKFTGENQRVPTRGHPYKTNIIQFPKQANMEFDPTKPKDVPLQQHLRFFVVSLLRMTNERMYHLCFVIL